MLLQRLWELKLEWDDLVPDVIQENMATYENLLSWKPTLQYLFTERESCTPGLEMVSNLTTDCFLATLRRFISRRGKSSLIWSDNGSNFVGAGELKNLTEFIDNSGNQSFIVDFCTTQSIHWKFIPERAPHFGGLWEAAVKSMKRHLRHIASHNKLTFEEYSTVLSQIEACLNSHPLVPSPHDYDGHSHPVISWLEGLWKHCLILLSHTGRYRFSYVGIYVKHWFANSGYAGQLN